MIAKIFLSLRPADLLNVVFLLFLTAVTTVFHEKVKSSETLILIYSGLILIQVLLILFRERGSAIRLVYDLVFPTVCILFIFDSLEGIVHFINPRDIDPLLIRLDYLLFNGYPTIMMEKIIFPVLTDILQIAYSSYYFLPVTLGLVLRMKRDEPAFDRSLFLIMLCFYLSYLGYMLMPALGPRYTMNHLQTRELEGFIAAMPIQELLNRLEGVKRDAFPSGHTGIALTVLYLAFRFEKRLYWIFLPCVAALIFSTVYCRYHYVVDVIAGILLFFITLLLGEALYGYRAKRVDLSR
ncbi:MAG: phosphatase PAP2 family protein [Nitrospirae bacterium]|nr:phosphatase PAP2 family protein [Nitrospirota bacterium]